MIADVNSFALPIMAQREQERNRLASMAAPPSAFAPTASQYNALATYGGPTRSAAMASGGMDARIYSGLVERGLPPHIAEGFVMNMRDESGLNPGINEIKPLVPGSRGGFGLYQLTGPRRRTYEQYAQERGDSFDDIDAQLDFLMYELQGPESRAAEAIFATSTPGEAGAAIVNKFLRPAEQHRAKRAARYLRSGGYSGPRQLPADAEQTPRPIPQNVQLSDLIQLLGA